MAYDHEFEEQPDSFEGQPENIAGADDDSDAPIELTGIDATDIPAPVISGDVRAESVTISQGSANSIEADTVSINQGGVAQLRAAEVSVSQGGVAIARTEHLTVSEDASAFAVLADSAEVHEGGNVFLLIARSTTGEIRPVLDWRAALAIGAGFAIVLRLLRRR
jgi:hypothetical protein